MSTGISAPPEVQLRLLDLQAADDELGRIAGHRRRLQSGADIAAVEAERTAARRRAAEQRGVLEDLRTRVRRLEADVAVVEQRLARDRDRLAATSSARDAQGLEQEIASLTRRRGALEDDELELMEAAEQAEAESAATAEAIAALDERLTALTGDRDDALAGLAEQQRAAQARRAEVAASLPEDLLGLYDRQRTRYGIGAARLVGTVSQGSNMALTGADLAEVRAAAPDAVVLDPESSCILVRAIPA
ncbi:zinc ribbon domain-containing protein [Amnibacterium endophyticum]|uniref:Zinc ribbon domain-containing protein n=1 Tax=Amnibacterium endophyticum TaxID=2109337 RepID=A0ABW4LIQ0_9MICO